MSILRRTRGPSTLGKHKLTYASRYASASVLRQLSNRDATSRIEQNSSTTSENTSRASDSIVSASRRTKAHLNALHHVHQQPASNARLELQR